MVHVVEPLDRAFYPELTPPFPTALAEIERARVHAGNELVKRAVSRLQAGGYAAGGKMLRGHVRSAILDAAEKWPADMILLGCRGRTGVKRVLLGSVSDQVACQAHCSVLIVRPKGL